MIKKREWDRPKITGKGVHETIHQTLTVVTLRREWVTRKSMSEIINLYIGLNEKHKDAHCQWWRYAPTWRLVVTYSLDILHTFGEVYVAIRVGPITHGNLVVRYCAQSCHLFLLERFVIEYLYFWSKYVEGWHLISSADRQWTKKYCCR